jgi:hypothetical protein
LRSGLQTRPLHVQIYDADGINPYGREVAALLARDNEVEYYCPRTVSWVPASVNAHRRLASSKIQDGLFGHVWRRVFMPILILTNALLRRRVFLVLWTRGAWDAALFAAAAPFLRGLVVVNHNPASIRPAGGRLRPGAEALLKRRASRTIVHDAALLPHAARESTRVCVAVHPPYTAWVDAYCATDRASTDGGPQAAFLGAARPDKGVGDFVNVLMQMKTRPLRAAFLGKGHLTHDQVNALTDAGVEVVLPHTDFLSDEELGQGLRGTDLVIAPYRQVTQSGSVLLALSAGVNVVAYHSAALETLLSDRCLVTPGDVHALAMAADANLDSQAPNEVPACMKGLVDAAYTEWNAALRQSKAGGDL